MILESASSNLKIDLQKEKERTSISSNPKVSKKEKKRRRKKS